MLSGATDMSDSLPSRFERLFVNLNEPISVYIRLYHSNFSPTFPVTNLLSFLPLPSKLSLRHVSPTTKAWLDSADLSIFSNLSVFFPLKLSSAEELRALYNTSPQCEHLTVTVLQPRPTPRAGKAIPLPPFPRLTHLHLTAPDHGSFQALLSFRHALQSAHVPLLSHLTINNLSFQGILALRWGSFTSFGDAGWTDGNVWHGLKELDLKLVVWWEDEAQANEPHSHREAEQWGTEQQGSRRRKQDWRTSTRVLHDWLSCFAAHGQLHTFRFEWLGRQGPNPVLLDQVVATDGKRQWFSAPGIRWSGLRELRLGNVVVSSENVRRMKERMAGLELLVVPPECLTVDIVGLGIRADGRIWVGVSLEDPPAGEGQEAVPAALSPSSVAATRGSDGESLASEDRASMVLPFMLDIPQEGFT